MKKKTDNDINPKVLKGSFAYGFRGNIEMRIQQYSAEFGTRKYTTQKASADREIAVQRNVSLPGSKKYYNDKAVADIGKTLANTLHEQFNSKQFQALPNYAKVAILKEFESIVQIVNPNYKNPQLASMSQQKNFLTNDLAKVNNELKELETRLAIANKEVELARAKVESTKLIGKGAANHNLENAIIAQAKVQREMATHCELIENINQIQAEHLQRLESSPPLPDMDAEIAINVDYFFEDDIEAELDSPRMPERQPPELPSKVEQRNNLKTEINELDQMIAELMPTPDKPLNADDTTKMKALQEQKAKCQAQLEALKPNQAWAKENRATANDNNAPADTNKIDEDKERDQTPSL